MSVQEIDDLIFDVGLHDGQDTEFYLRKGYRVVAIEANPDLVALVSERFSAEISQGRLIIESGAICEDDFPNEHITFFLNQAISVWGTIKQDWVTRNAELGFADIGEVKVTALKFKDILQKHGIPHYVKIDIEGADPACLKAISEVEPRPRFVSIESNKTSYEGLCAELHVLHEAGYRRFALMQQAWIVRNPVDVRTRDGKMFSHRFRSGASGVFGEDIPEQAWISCEEAQRRYRRIFREYRWFGDDRRRLWRGVGKAIGRLLRRPLPGWYDTHARLD